MIQYKLNGFEYQNVTLLDSPFAKQRQETIELYLENPALEDILYNDRVMAGLPTKGDGMTGWGPSIGQYFSSFAKLFKATGDQRVFNRGMALFDGWTECADRKDAVYHRGTYMFDKFLGGLLDMYEYMGVERARHYIEKLTEHAQAGFIKSIPRDGLQDSRMQGQIEWYTLPEQLYRAYQLFGDPLYKAFADEWLYDYMWDKILKDDFWIGPRHAYSHVNCLSSAARAYIVTGQEKYLSVIEKAYQELLLHHTYATGGYGPAETLFGDNEGYLGDMLKSPWDFPNGKDCIYNNFAGGSSVRSDTWGSCEVSCCTWAVFKLSNYLLKLTGNARYGSWAEKLLINGLLGQLPITKDGKVMYYASYFMNGAVKTVVDRRLTEDGGNNVWQCCTGTFPQDVAEYANMLYYQDQESLYISQFMSSNVTFSHAGQTINLIASTRFPEEMQVVFTINTEQPVVLQLKIRVPSWITKDAAVYIGNEKQNTDLKPDTWLTLNREWQNGDAVHVEFPYTLKFQSVDHVNDNIVALTYGPVVLASSEMTILVGDRENPADWIIPVPGEFAVFQTVPGHAGRQASVTRIFRPYYKIGPMEWYYMYFPLFSDGSAIPKKPWL